MSRRLFIQYCLLSLIAATLILLGACSKEFESKVEKSTSKLPVTIHVQTGLTPPQHPRRLVFDNVNVITMDENEPDILMGQRVVVVSNRITIIDNAKDVPFAVDDKVIDAQGGYLLPGLIDSHAHLRHEPSASQSIVEIQTSPAQMSIFLQQGITTLRNYSGAPNELQWRDKVNTQQWLGTRIISSGPIISLYEPEDPFLGAPHEQFSEEFLNTLSLTWPKTPLEAEQVVLTQKQQGYDFIKVYSGVSEEIYSQVSQTAKVQNLFLAGHIPDVPMSLALKNQNEIAHLSEIIAGRDRAPEGMDDETYIDWLIDRMLKNNISLVFNWSTDEVVSRWAQGEDIYRSDSYNVIPQPILDAWQQEERHTDIDPELHDIALMLVKALVDEGIAVQVGSDTGDAGSIPELLLRDMELMVEAGLTPLQALGAATNIPAQVISRITQQPQDRGVIKPDYLADLVLFKNNPLEDISHIRTRIGVVINGHWLSQQQLDNMAHEFASQNVQYLELP
ncbi:Imidazolonepropionase [Pseudoalteromonas holothuriae]|uniref:Imidazolonepropionase n=1 Tax=Pseudoalteromonas holothuriae TaxID=2963714 RepID=A0A9W4R354_9GAMM|nr:MULTISPECIES: amidohydrolase family protein [unclassified Pseudoalteromonas]CAH9064447.1 Imidazolonepropionase [Pseudoalteromonas sp. CIP111854]CAH9065400.1 Imidazolonepropionase [Pseudoalteromonas sp. CIP111951]